MAGKEHFYKISVVGSNKDEKSKPKKGPNLKRNTNAKRPLSILK